jgi:putative heme transporter
MATAVPSDPQPSTGAPAVPHRRRHPALGTAVHWALLLGALAYAGYQAPALVASVRDGGRWVHQLRWGAAGVALLLTLLSIAAYAELHRRLLAVGGAHVPASSVQAITFASNAVANTVPVVGGAAAIAYSISRFHRRGADPALATWATLLAGLVSTLCLVVLGAAGLASAGAVPVGPAVVVGLATAALSILGWHVVSHPAVLGHALTLVLGWVRRAPTSCEPCRAGWADNLTRTVADVTGRIALLRPSAVRWLWIIGLAALSWALDVGALSTCAYAVLGRVPWGSVVEGFLIVQASIALQVLPGGAGLAEVGLVGIFASGTPAGAAAAVTVVYRAVSWLLPSLLGWIVYARQIHTLGPASDRHGPAVAGPTARPLRV